MSKTRAVIFDRDGVLTFFLVQKGIEYISKYIPGFNLQSGLTIWESLGQLHGFPKNPEEEILFFSKFWLALADHYTISPEQQAAIQQINYLEFVDIFPDTLPALELCKQKKMKIGVLSNFPLASLRDSLKKFKLDGYIDEALSASVIGARKPEPQAYLALCEKLAVSPEECVFFDDERVCVTGAQETGMTAYWVNREQEGHDLAKNIITNLNALDLIL